MANTELYSRLGVGPEASEAEITQAYNRLIADCNPATGDLSPEQAKRYDYLTQAYMVLSNVNSRANYDIRGVVSVKGKHRSSTGISSARITSIRTALNSAFMIGAVVSVILYLMYKSGMSPTPFLIVCGISLVIKIADYILRFIF